MVEPIMCKVTQIILLMNKVKQSFFTIFTLFISLNCVGQFEINVFDENWSDNFIFPAEGFVYDKGRNAIVYSPDGINGTSIAIESDVFDSARWTIDFVAEAIVYQNTFARYYIASDSRYFNSANAYFVEFAAHGGYIRLCEQGADGHIEELIVTSPIAINQATRIEVSRNKNGEWTLRSWANGELILNEMTIYGGEINSIYAGIRVKMQPDNLSLIAITSLSAYGVTPPPIQDTTYTSSSLLHSIVFTEIMADPSPTVGLPEVEYLEIYNRTDSTIDLSACKLYVGDQHYGELYPCALPPYTYALLCSETHILDMADFPNVIPVMGFRPLINDGRVVMLRSAANDLLAWLDYSPDWHNSRKRDGGYSLERRDVNNLCVSFNAFLSSIDVRGGTPSEPNSVAENYPDKLFPLLCNAYLHDDSTIKLEFNKELSSDISAIYVDDMLQSQYVLNTPYNNTVTIPLSTTVDTSVSVSIEGVKCVSAYAMPDTVVTIYRSYPPQPGDLFITEIMYNPTQSRPSYIEVYNTSDHHLSMNFTLEKYDSDGDFRTYYDLDHSTNTLPPSSFAVITPSTSTFSSHYDVCSDAIILPMDDNILTSSGASIALTLSAGDILLDSIPYSDSMHSPWVQSIAGVSLEKININDPIFSHNNWTSAASTADHATPGCQNSQSLIIDTFLHPSDKYFYLECDHFTPNNDAYNDVLRVHYSLPSEGYSCSAAVYTPEGNRLVNLLTDALIPAQGSFTWQGTTSDGVLLPFGAYVLVIEAIHPDGAHFTQQLVVVLAL